MAEAWDDLAAAIETAFANTRAEAGLTEVTGPPFFSGELAEALHNEIVTGGTRALWAQPYTLVNTGTQHISRGDHGVMQIGSVSSIGDAHFSIAVPSDFGTQSKLVIVVSPGQTGNLRWNADSDYGADGEAYNVHSETVAEATLAVIANEMTELDVSGLASSLAAGDYLGVKLRRHGDDALDTITNLYVHGLLLEYTPG